jgi:hypothetical protein
MADYVCKSDLCYDFQSPQMHASIIAFQNAINRFTPDMGISPIAADGIIGTGALTALYLALMHVTTNSPWTDDVGLANGYYDTINTSEDAIKLVEPSAGSPLTAFLETAANNLGFPAQVAPAQVSAPSSPPKAKTPSGAAKLLKTQAQKSAVGGPLNMLSGLPTWMQILLGAAVTGGGIVAYKHYKTR